MPIPAIVPTPRSMPLRHPAKTLHIQEELLDFSREFRWRVRKYFGQQKLAMRVRHSQIQISLIETGHCCCPAVP